MTAATEVQALLRFLTKEARLPLALALPKISELRKIDVKNPENISTADQNALRSIFPDEKVLKRVQNAAKRVANPRKRSNIQQDSPTSKRAKNDPTPTSEADLALPTSLKTVEELAELTVETNRSPLFLAYTVISLRYTHPEQPLSSQLSIAQALLSTNAQSKAKYIGLTHGPTAEEDGWAEGQPKIRVMGKDVAVMRRQIPQPLEKDQDFAEIEGNSNDLKSGDGGEAEQGKIEPVESALSSHEAFWGIDLEALRKSNGPLISGSSLRGRDGPPIHSPKAARNYLLKSMDLVETAKDSISKVPKSKKQVTAEIVERKETAVALTLKAIDLVFQSWNDYLTRDELDRKAQSWYISTRPDVEQGQAGWGQKGYVRLIDILKLRRAA